MAEPEPVTVATTDLDHSPEGWNYHLRLSRPHQVFIHEYFSNGGRAAKAYKVAYPGVEDTTARSEGSRLLRNPNVAPIIDAARKIGWNRVTARCGVTLENILGVLSDLATGDPGRVVQWGRDGTVTLTPSEELTAVERMMVEGVKSRRGGGVEVKFVNRLEAIARLAHLKGWGARGSEGPSALDQAAGVEAAPDEGMPDAPVL